MHVVCTAVAQVCRLQFVNQCRVVLLHVEKLLLLSRTAVNCTALQPQRIEPCRTIWKLHSIASTEHSTVLHLCRMHSNRATLSSSAQHRTAPQCTALRLHCTHTALDRTTWNHTALSGITPHFNRIALHRVEIASYCTTLRQTAALCFTPSAPSNCKAAH